MERNPDNGSEYVSIQAAVWEGDKIVRRDQKLLDKVWPSDMIRLANKLGKIRRDKLKANLDELGYNRDEQLERLNAFDSRPIDRADIASWGLKPDGTVEVLKCVLRHAYNGTEVPAADECHLNNEVDRWVLPPAEMVIASAGCLHIVLGRPEDTARPTTPEAEGQTVSATSTGGPKPDESTP